MKNAIHICHITTVHPAGDVRIFHKECRSLQAAGHRVTLLAANAKSATIEGVEIIGIPVEFSGRFGRMRKVSKVLFQKAIELDAAVYHFHDPEFLKYALKLRKLGKHVIYDVHEDVPRQILAKFWIPKLMRGVISRSFERFENRVSAQLSYICTATPHIRDRFLKLNPNTIDINNFPRLDELAEVSPYESKEQAVCYIGGMTEVRGILELIGAVAEGDYTLHLAGTFAPETLREKAMDSAGWARVEEHGFLDRDGVRSVLKRSKVGAVTLHPTINYVDALPVKMFEYMAAGIAVLASDFPLWKAIVEENECGVCVDPLNSAAIGKAIQKLLSDDEKAALMGQNGRKAVEEKYNWAIEEAKLLKVYATLLG
jgi:glycosyltransferase involved in cell wall biosynthesis